MSRIEPRPIIDLSRPKQQPTQVLDLSRTLRMHTVRLEISENLLSELREAPAAKSIPQVVPPPAANAAQSHEGETLLFQPAPVQTLFFARPRDLEQKPPSVDLANTLYDGGALREFAAQLVSEHESEPPAARAQGAPEPARQLTAGVLRRPLSVLRRPLSVLRSCSLPKQLTIVLLPLAIASVWAMRDGSASASGSRALPARPAPARPLTPAMVSAAVGTSASPAPNAPSKPNTPNTAGPFALETAAQPHDPSERLALIAAFSGNKAEAAALYERLAVTRNSRVFALAARLTREDRVRKP